MRPHRLLQKYLTNCYPTRLIQIIFKALLVTVCTQFSWRKMTSMSGPKLLTFHKLFWPPKPMGRPPVDMQRWFAETYANSRSTNRNEKSKLRISVGEQPLRSGSGKQKYSCQPSYTLFTFLDCPFILPRFCYDCRTPTSVLPGICRIHRFGCSSNCLDMPQL